ncbi:MAG: hypothetical protein GEV00_13800 [Actinophytocola sp.]|nr:hypothetical protein [Actinophytocola sp.]
MRRRSRCRQQAARSRQSARPSRRSAPHRLPCRSRRSRCSPLNLSRMRGCTLYRAAPRPCTLSRKARTWPCRTPSRAPRPG